MKWMSKGLILFVAVLHVYIAWIEIFAWVEKGAEVFVVFPRELFEQTKIMAINQGVYNLFLALGLAWSLFIRDPLWHRRTALCFLSFVIAA